MREIIDWIWNTPALELFESAGVLLGWIVMVIVVAAFWLVCIATGLTVASTVTGLILLYGPELLVRWTAGKPEASAVPPGGDAVDAAQAERPRGWLIAARDFSRRLRREDIPLFVLVPGVGLVVVLPLGVLWLAAWILGMLVQA